MKRKIVLILVMLFIVVTMGMSLVACNGSGVDSSSSGANNANKGTALTMSNYEDYLKISARFSGDNAYYYGGGEYWHKNIIGSVSITPTSDRFDFTDAEITVKIAGVYYIVGDGGLKSSSRERIYNENITVSLNLVGQGSAKKIVSITDTEGFHDYAYAVSGLGYEVVSVSGYVKTYSNK